MVLFEKAALYLCCQGGGVLLCSEGAFCVAIDCYDAAWAGHLELEISVVWHCVKRCSSKQCVVAAAEGEKMRLGLYISPEYWASPPGVSELTYHQGVVPGGGSVTHTCITVSG